MKSQNNSQSFDQIEGLIKYHENEYANINEQYSVMLLAFRINNKVKRLCLDGLMCLLGGIGFYILPFWIFMLFGMIDGSIQTYQELKLFRDFRNWYPHDTDLLHENVRYLLQNVHELGKEMKVQESVLDHLKKQQSSMEQVVEQKEDIISTTDHYDFQTESDKVLGEIQSGFVKRKNYKNSNLRYRY